MTLSTRVAAPPVRQRSLKAGLPTRVAAALLRQRSLWAGVVIATVVILTAACGKKGPPLAPFARVPAVVGNVTAQRIGDDVFVSFPVPTTNVDGQQPADIGSLEVYAITATKPPETDEHRKLATLVATLPVKPLLPAGIPPDGPAVDADGKPRASDVPAIPAPPGIDRAVPAVVKESLTPDKRVPVELPARTVTLAAPVDEEVIARPLIAPTADRVAAPLLLRDRGELARPQGAGLGARPRASRCSEQRAGCAASDISPRRQ